MLIIMFIHNITISDNRDAFGKDPDEKKFFSSRQFQYLLAKN